MFDLTKILQFLLLILAALCIVWVVKMSRQKTPAERSELEGILKNLSKNDLLHVRYMLEGLSLKESAVKINVTSHAVEKARFRLKKKLGLKRSEGLRNHLVALQSEGYFEV